MSGLNGSFDQWQRQKSGLVALVRREQLLDTAQAGVRAIYEL